MIFQFLSPEDKLVFDHIWYPLICPLCSLQLSTLDSFPIIVSLGGGHWGDMNAGWLARWTRAIRGSLPTPLSLECMLYPPFPQWELFQRHNLEKVRWCWDHLESISDWMQFRPLYKLLRFGGWMQRSICLAAAQDKPCKFPRLFNQPPANLEWSASFFSLLSLPVRGPVWEPTASDAVFFIGLTFRKINFYCPQLIFIFSLLFPFSSILQFQDQERK